MNTLFMAVFAFIILGILIVLALSASEGASASNKAPNQKYTKLLSVN